METYPGPQVSVRAEDRREKAEKLIRSVYFNLEQPLEITAVKLNHFTASICSPSDPHRRL